MQKVKRWRKRSHQAPAKYASAMVKSAVKWNSTESFYLWTVNAGKMIEWEKHFEGEKQSPTASCTINKNSVKSEIHQQFLLRIEWEGETERKSKFPDRVCTSEKTKPTHDNHNSKTNNNKRRAPRASFQFSPKLPAIYVWTGLNKYNKSVLHESKYMCIVVVVVVVMFHSFSLSLSSCVFLLQIFSHYSWLHFLLSTFGLVQWAAIILLKPASGCQKRVWGWCALSHTPIHSSNPIIFLCCIAVSLYIIVLCRTLSLFLIHRNDAELVEKKARLLLCSPFWVV